MPPRRAAVVEEEEVVPPPPRPPLLWPWLLLLLLLVVGGLLAAYFLTRDNDKGNNKTVTAVTVPGVVGLGQDAAVRRLNERGLTPRLISRPSRFPRGTVFAQDPGAGTKVARKSGVRLAVSAAAVTRVPNVVGARTVVALRTLRVAGLRSQVTAIPATAPAGIVVGESPRQGSRVAKGSTVSLRVSRGQAIVPDVREQPALAARAALRAAGLIPSVFHVPGVQLKGTVTAQKPLPGRRVPRGSKVRINVSTGAGAPAPTTTTSGTTPTHTATTSTTTTTQAPARVNAPNVVGLQQSTAQRRLHAAGLGVHVVYINSSRPRGQVVVEKPAAGTAVPKGARVTIRVSLGPGQPTTATVPDVVGQDQQTAATTLQDADFTVQVITVPPEDPSQEGTVVDEQPTGGTRAPVGSPVTIYVARSTAG